MYPDVESAARLTGVAASRAFFAPCFGGGDALLVAHVDDHARCLHLASYPGGKSELPIRDIIADAARLESAGLSCLETLSEFS